MTPSDILLTLWAWLIGAVCFYVLSARYNDGRVPRDHRFFCAVIWPLSLFVLALLSGVHDEEWEDR